MQEYILTLLQCKQDFIKIVQLIRAGCQMVKACLSSLIGIHSIHTIKYKTNNNNQTSKQANTTLSEQFQKIPHCRNSSKIPHCRNSSKIPHCQNSSKIPHCRNSSKIPHCRNSSKIPHCRNSSKIQNRRKRQNRYA